MLVYLDKLLNGYKDIIHTLLHSINDGIIPFENDLTDILDTHAHKLDHSLFNSYLRTQGLFFEGTLYIFNHQQEHKMLYAWATKLLKWFFGSIVVLAELYA